MQNIIETLVDQAVTRRQLKDDAERDNSKFRVSDAGKCRLMRYWKRQGKPAEKDVPIETLRAMQQGINVHEYIQQAIVDLPGVENIITEYHLEDEHRIGHFDLYLALASPLIDERHFMGVLYDIKSKGGKQWYYFDRDGRQPDIIHIYQLTTYWLMATNQGKESFPITQCRLVYVNRDTLDIYETEVIVEAYERDVKADWELLISHWEKQEEPEASPATKWECRYCPYYRDCGF